MEPVGQMIKRYREDRDKTQEEVALAVGVTFGAVSQWEKGRTHPRQAVAFKLDDFLRADGAIVAALGYARPTTEPPAGVLFRLDELERLTAVMATELRELADAVVDLADMSHQHAGRRRGEGIASGQ